MKHQAVCSYDGEVAPSNLNWQSKLVLLLVVPWTALSVVNMARWEFSANPPFAMQALGLSAVLGVLAWLVRSATAAAALTGAMINASLMFTMASPPLQAWHSGMVPVLIVLILTSLATRFGRRRKERLGTAEKRKGRGAAQVAANLGMAAQIMDPLVQSSLIDSRWLAGTTFTSMFAVGLAALAEAAADTVSSEIGQVLGGTPCMITTLRRVEPGTDGGITAAGTLAGIVAAGLVALAGYFALHLQPSAFFISWAGGVFGLLFDSLLGATCERAGWINNDGVNFVSTASAVACALGLLAVIPHPGIG
jgi:uncharacterized protein (TIGR00297 family)